MSKLVNSVFHVRSAPCGQISSNASFKVTEQPSSLHYDSCYQSIQKKQSAGPGAYSLENYHSCNCEAPEVQKAALPGSRRQDFYRGHFA